MSDADPIGEDSGQRAEESASPRREPGEGPQRSWSRPALLGYALLAVSLVWLWQQGLASLAYQTISYRDFKRHLAAGEVVEVSLGPDEITGKLKPAPAASAQPGEAARPAEVLFRTVRV